MVYSGGVTPQSDLVHRSFPEQRERERERGRGRGHRQRAVAYAPALDLAMALHCNIDAKGKLIRLIYGVAFTLIGALLAAFWAWPRGGALPWIVSLALLLGGAFAIFESRRGWCALRALGIKTPF